MTTYIIDTSIVSHILRRDAHVIERLEQVVSGNSRMVLCPVVYYEILRGLRKTHSPRLSAEFSSLASFLIWDDMKRTDWDQAGELWASAAQRGLPRNDADVLIAAYALRRSAVLVTDNESHFQHFGLEIENWANR